MVFSCVRGFLIGSGGVFWILITILVVMEVRTRLWMRRNKDELDPDFGGVPVKCKKANLRAMRIIGKEQRNMDRQLDSTMVSNAIDLGTLIARLRRSTRELGVSVTAAREGIKGVALEDRIIMTEINLLLGEVGLVITQKE
jgi:hypothetical protein